MTEQFMCRARLVSLSLVLIVLPTGCAHFLEHERAAEVLRVKEYDQKLSIKETDPAAPQATEAPAPVAVETPAETEAPKKHAKHVAKKAKSSKKGKVKNANEVATLAPSGARQPEIEDSEGFNGRRPKVDPFRVGEKVTFDLSYFKIVAGQLDVEVKPFATVNGEKAYHFGVSARSNSFFSRIYSVEDKAVTYMSYDRLVPLNLQISIKESKQLAEARTFFDWKTPKASYWQNRITKEHGEQSKKLDWDIQAYSQNVISAAYYLRTFQISPGKNLAFRVADEGKNIVFKGEVLRREKLDTAIGELDTLVIKPELTVDGVFAPVGEILIWVADDDRKFLVRLESKIKIGTIVAKLKSIEKGHD